MVKQGPGSSRSRCASRRGVGSSRQVRNEARSTASAWGGRGADAAVPASPFTDSIHRSCRRVWVPSRLHIQTRSWLHPGPPIRPVVGQVVMQREQAEVQPSQDGSSAEAGPTGPLPGARLPHRRHRLGLRRPGVPRGHPPSAPLGWRRLPPQRGTALACKQGPFSDIPEGRFRRRYRCPRYPTLNDAAGPRNDVLRGGANSASVTTAMRPRSSCACAAVTGWWLGAAPRGRPGARRARSRTGVG